jgi:hypothetical protein
MSPTPNYFWQAVADCVSEDDDEENNPWKPMLDRIKARRQKRIASDEVRAAT